VEAYAENFDIMKHANSPEVPEDHRFDLNLTEIAEVWRRSSVVGNWLLDLTAMALLEHPELKRFTGNVADSGEGRWTIMAAIEEAVPCDVLSASLFTRFRSRQDHNLCGEDPLGNAQQIWRPRGAPRRRIVHLIDSIFSRTTPLLPQFCLMSNVRMKHTHDSLTPKTSLGIVRSL
jgi:6-phosphogluconate dehydrogenase